MDQPNGRARHGATYHYTSLANISPRLGTVTLSGKSYPLNEEQRTQLDTMKMNFVRHAGDIEIGFALNLYEKPVTVDIRAICVTPDSPARAGLEAIAGKSAKSTVSECPNMVGYEKTVESILGAFLPKAHGRGGRG